MAAASGMLTYNSKENERGGYLTADDDGSCFMLAMQMRAPD